jgi:GTP-binding protein
MFVDTAKVFIQAGKGGDGAMSFRHEIYVAKGGPDGGNGGRGGDVIFLATENVNTLLDFRYKPELKAQDGTNGSKRDRNGKAGENFIVKVPIGTIVKRDGKVIADLTENNQEVIIAKGGSGGFGNAHFKSSTRQTPRIAERGEPGDKFEAELELKLLADVGLVGLPNAGKSTFLSVVSNARPEIADYPFTTLTPNLGVADIDESSLLIADIPGLIEGAFEGKGLGDAFLRHVERTAVLLHLVDIYNDDVAESYKTIRKELEKYSPELATRPEIIALTKSEGVDEEIVQMQVDSLKLVSPKSEIIVVSSASQKGIKEVLRSLVKLVEKVNKEKAEQEEVVDSEIPVITLSEGEISEKWKVERVDPEEGPAYFVVRGDKIEKFARRTHFEQYEGVNRLRDIMKKLGITHELRRKGAENESIIRIDGYEFTLVEQ